QPSQHLLPPASRRSRRKCSRRLEFFSRRSYRGRRTWWKMPRRHRRFLRSAVPWSVF
ncbi:unnamed protein product, partial [Scytosiphon promiscuus]